MTKTSSGLRNAVAVASTLMFATGVLVRDLESIAIAVLLVLAYALLRFRNGLGKIGLAVLFVDVLAWMAPAVWSLARHGDGLASRAVPSVLVIACLSGLGTLVRVPSRVAAILVPVFFVLLSPIVGDAQRVPETSASVRPISSRGAKFSTSRLVAKGDQITIVFHNKDLFWHTVTINDLDVSINAPANATRFERFTAAPGTYEFVCAIPGHESAGMKGTLVVT